VTEAGEGWPLRVPAGTAQTAIPQLDGPHVFGRGKAPFKQVYEAVINGIHFAADVFKLNV